MASLLQSMWLNIRIALYMLIMGIFWILLMAVFPVIIVVGLITYILPLALKEKWQEVKRDLA